jgi:hypothetical protein
MKDSECRYGIYLVGWFVCPQWDPDDSRRGATPKISIQGAQQKFEMQAAELSVGGNLVRALVMNTALP